MTGLPPICEALLDDDQVAQLLCDIAALGQDVTVATRGAGARRADPAPVALADVGALLRARDLGGVQLRYVHEGEAWCDTLSAVPAGWRLVRISHSRALESALQGERR